MTLIQSKSIGEGKFDLYLKVILVYSIIVTLIYEFTKYSIKGNILNIRGGFLINKDIDIPSIEKLKYNNKDKYREYKKTSRLKGFFMFGNTWSNKTYNLNLN